MNTKLHAVTDANGRPISFFMTAGQVTERGKRAILSGQPSELGPKLKDLSALIKQLASALVV
jgi:transposase